MYKRSQFEDNKRKALEDTLSEIRELQDHYNDTLSKLTYFEDLLVQLDRDLDMLNDQRMQIEEYTYEDQQAEFGYQDYKDSRLH